MEQQFDPATRCRGSIESFLRFGGSSDTFTIANFLNHSKGLEGFEGN
jgi:hypothetical protein